MTRQVPKTMRIIAAVTIGQSPRDDIVPELSRFVPGARWIEAGALDGLDDETIATLAPAAGDFPLVTRLRSSSVGVGRSVVVGERAVTPLLQRAVARVGAQADLVIVLCTGQLAVQCGKPLLFPGHVLAAMVAAVHGGRPIMVLTPHEAQVPPQLRRWRERGVDVTVLFASPYSTTDFAALGRRARESGAALVVMDCLGYTLAMKDAVVKRSGLPAILARSIVARVAAELLE